MKNKPYFTVTLDLTSYPQFQNFDLNDVEQQWDSEILPEVLKQLKPLG
jgi:hypothetical protein